MGMWEKDYARQTGQSARSNNAKLYASRRHKQLGGLGVSVGGLGAGMAAEHRGGPAMSLYAGSIAGSTYSVYQGHKADKMLKAGVHPNQRNAATGVRSSNPTPTRTMGRVQKKG